MDDADRAEKHSQEALDRSIEAARGEVQEGRPGDCEICGEWFGRLVNGVCVLCREKYGME